MKKTLLTLAATFCYSLFIFAQVPPQRDCGTMQHHEFLKQTRPTYETDLNQYNQVIEQYLADKAAGLSVGKSSAAIVTIPVVVHVIYRVAGENISDAQAISQVQVLNDDFAKLNTDASKVTQATFSTVASGANIRFCLAQRDPNGNPTTGVTHKATSTVTFSTNDAVKSTATGGEDAWDVTKYVNIWVCNMGSTLLGYGEFPTGALSNTWGLVLHYKYTGKNGTAIAPYNLGRTGTHEFGHCFNLLHIWGDDGTACTGSDQCTDTPNQAGEHYGCFPQGSIQTDGCTSTGSGVMWMNYMDYTDDACMYMFTAQQVARMEAVVNTSPWNVLQTSLGCTPVSALDVGITSVIAPVNGSSSCNTSVTPKITLNNAGSTTLTSAVINYKMDATATQTLAWTGSLANSTSTIVTLNTYSGLTNAAHSFSVWVTSPNGGVDANSINNSMSSTFTVIAVPIGTGLPFVERFDAVTFPPTGWVKLASNTLNAANTWTRVANTTGIPVVPTTTACAKMDNFSGGVDITGQLDALRTPALSFTGANSSLNVTFDVSHKMYSAGNVDTLNVFISSDCGGSWTNLYSKGGTQLATAGTQTTAFTPTANAQWRRETVSLTAYAGLPMVYLKFESRSGWGNNVYLDNVNVTYTPTSSPPVASFSSTATKCSGTAITFSDLSTNTPTSWAWGFPGGTPSTSTAQNPSITYTASGIYTVTLASANSSGTSTPVSQTITVNATPLVAVNNTTICSGTSATLSATGATTYSWNTGATTSSISVTPSVTTNYTVTGTNAGGCINTKTVSVTVNTTPTVVVNSVTVCSGTSANLSATGATTYSWNTGATTSSISVTPSVTTNYTVTGTTVGCIDTKTVNITVNTTPTVVVNSVTVCSGTPANLSATGATTYSWNTGATTSSISVTPSVTTNYTVTGTNAGGCINTKTVSVTVNTTPTVVVNSATICSGTPANLSATGATTYSWNTGATTSSISVTPSVTTNYTVTGTNTGGCINTKTVSVTVNTTPTVVVNSATICSGTPANLSATGATTYSWNTGATTSSISVTPSVTTNYTVTGTNTGGCINTKTVSVTVNTTPTVVVNSATICSGTPANLSATGATTYSWNTGATTSSISVTPSVTTNYTVTGTNTGGCINTKTVSVTVNTTPTVVVNSATICSGTPANLSATGATTYSWNTGTTTSSISVTPSVNTNYTVTGTNTGGCINTKTVSVTVNTTPTVVVNSTTVCSGTSANLSATGATTYSWNTGATTSSISVSPSVTTNYTVTGTNTGGCINTKTVSVTVNTTPTVVVNSTTVCSGTSANLSATGATTYSWNTGATTSSISVTPSVTTNYTVTGANTGGCINTKTVSVNVNAIPSIAVSNATICSGSTGTLVASGANTYTWNTGATGANLPVSPAVNTNYTVTGVSAAGCVNTATASVTVGSAPSIAVNSTSICSGSTATLTASGVSTFTWSTGLNTASLSVNPTSTTVYTVSGNLVGCASTAINTATVTVISNPTVVVNSATVCSGISANLSATGATTYSWNTGTTTSSISVTPSVTTNYTVTGMNAGGCINTKTVSVTVNTTPTVVVNSATICSGTSANLSASGAATYSWNTGATTSSVSVSPTVTTNYTVTGATGGCTNVKTLSVVVNITPIANAGSSQTITCLSPTVSLTGSGVSTYSWSGTGIVTGGNTSTPVVNSAGTYTLVGSTGGCPSSPVTVNIVANTSAPSVTSITSGSLNCVTTSVDIVSSTSVSPVSYTWTGSGITSGSATPTITVIQGGTFNYTVTDTSNGCSSTGSQVVTQNTVSPTVSVSSATICSGSTGTLTASGSAATYSWNTGTTGANLVLSPMSTANYTVTATNTITGCTNTATAFINVSSAPFISVNSSTICSGSTATLAASGVDTYTWSTTSNASSISVNPTGTMVYTVTGNLSGCSTQASQTATVTVNLLPNVTLGSISGPLCVNNATVTLSGSPAGGVYSGVGVSGASFDPAVSGAGTFTVTYDYTDANFCSAAANQTVNVNLCTGITELTSSSISVYPNPARDAIYISMDASFINNTTIELYDAIGKLVIKEKVVHATTFVNINSLSTGMYTLRVISDGKQISQRIIKQ